MTRKSPKCPKDCPDRDPWCHGTCEKYALQVEEHQAEKALIREDKIRRSDWTRGKGNSAMRRYQKKLKQSKS